MPEHNEFFSFFFETEHNEKLSLINLLIFLNLIVFHV
jgi:hypothetical protein